MTLEEYNLSVHDYSNRVCRFVDKLLLNTSAAKDVTQDAYLRLLQHREEVAAAKARAWLFTTAYRLSMDYLKYQNKWLGEEHLPDHSVEPQNLDLKQVMNEALSLLSEVQRSIVLLKDYEGYSYDEIGQMLELNESQVKVYLFRARKKMKEHIGDLKFVL